MTKVIADISLSDAAKIAGAGYGANSRALCFTQAC